MTVRELHARARRCTNMNALDELFVNASRYPFDGPKPRWGELQRIYNEAVKRITGGDMQTGEVTETYPF